MRTMRACKRHWRLKVRHDYRGIGCNSKEFWLSLRYDHIRVNV